MVVPMDFYHGHQHTILAVGVDGSSGATMHVYHPPHPCSLPPVFASRARRLFLSAMLVPLDSYHGHQHTILAVGVDGSSGATWSAAMDGSLIMWGGDGKVRLPTDRTTCVAWMDLLYSPCPCVLFIPSLCLPVFLSAFSPLLPNTAPSPRQSLLLGSHYVCGMDLLYTPVSLLLAAAPRDDMSEDDMSEGQAASNPVAPCILQLTGDEGAGGGGGEVGGGGWQVTGRLDRNQTSVISCIKAIGIHPDMAFITAESMAPSNGSPASPRDRICCYDLAGAPFSSLHPVRQYTEHEVGAR
ncbi:unnamed protein product [Closterium sp. NIES-64]|nr:unnamed protein product [Closterium sp. NIES-64]